MADRKQRRKADRSSSRPLVRAQYEDATGRLWAVWLPEGDADATKGVPIGPQDTSGLGLPDDVAVALHNQLFHRRLFNWADLRHNQRELLAAIQSAYKVDAGKVNNLYESLS